MRPAQKGDPQERQTVLQGREIRTGASQRGQEGSQNSEVNLHVPRLHYHRPGGLGELLPKAVTGVADLYKSRVTRF